MVLAKPIPAYLLKISHQQFGPFLVGAIEKDLGYLGLIVEVLKILIGQSCCGEDFDYLSRFGFLEGGAKALYGGKDVHFEVLAKITIAHLVLRVVYSSIDPIVGDVGSTRLQLECRFLVRLWLSRRILLL